jgi:hypothetical protein
MTLNRVHSAPPNYVQNPYLDPYPTSSLAVDPSAPYTPVPATIPYYPYVSVPMYSYPTYQYYYQAPDAEIEVVARPFYSKASYQLRPYRNIYGVPVPIPYAGGYTYQFGPYWFGYRYWIP